MGNGIAQQKHVLQIHRDREYGLWTISVHRDIEQTQIQFHLN